MSEQYDVFQKVLGHLAMYARSGDSDVADMLSAEFVEISDTPLTLIDHPFVCERGYVRHGVAPSIRLQSMLYDVTTCGAHTPHDTQSVRRQGCRMHPVVDDGRLAAYALGGGDAVVTEQRPTRGWAQGGTGWDKHVFASWQHMLDQFARMVTDYDNTLSQYDAAMANNTVAHVLPQNTRTLVVLAQDGLTAEKLTIHLRPSERRSRQRKKKR